ncbi:putative inositol phosphosphingolipids phospholipase [Diplogelasinospora grovesii]|uniref:Inositol phosphosphingolipids phospholipase n=1 Tax=Diplogelasinospora grovesii TaxID=303347 RepID=A0AAN6S6F1_9PEZI|nr:putative inositol phosphosphingolipids phospholipase [Diplogelasinospora grovesii]
MDELPTEISIVTLNCWGLKYISKYRRERLSEIGKQLAVADPQPHIVALQECWTQEDYQNIRRETRLVLPYGKFYFSGALGGGLAILSRWPIEESTMFRYPLNGRPTAFWRGDWYVGKGVACAKIRYGPGPKHVIEVFNTHTHAPYESGPNDSYLCHRTAQAWEISKLLRGAAERGHLVIGLGDFNMIPLSLEHRLITTHSPVRDTWRVLHPESSVGKADDPAERARHRPIPTAEFNILENGATSDGPYNTWRWSSTQQKLLGPTKSDVVIPPDTVDHKGKRLDYIFASTGDIPSLGGGWVVSRVSVGMMMRHPDLKCSLSDHFAAEATLTFHPLPTHHHHPSRNETIVDDDDDDDDDKDLHNGTYLQSPTASEFRGSKSFDAQLLSFDSQTQSSFLPPTNYDDILIMINRYVARERSQRKWRAIHFFVSLAITIACLIGVWFGPHNYVAFILMLVSSLGLTAGTIDGLLALLFFKAELRALKEFEWEIMNAKAAAGGGIALVQEVPDPDRSW